MPITLTGDASPELVQDLLSTALQNGGGLTWTYNDSAGTVTPAIDHGGVGGLSDDDHTQYFKVTGRNDEDLTLTGSGDILWATSGAGNIGAYAGNKVGHIYSASGISVIPTSAATESVFSYSNVTPASNNYFASFCQLSQRAAASSSLIGMYMQIATNGTANDRGFRGVRVENDASSTSSNSIHNGVYVGIYGTNAGNIGSGFYSAGVEGGVNGSGLTTGYNIGGKFGSASNNRVYGVHAQAGTASGSNGFITGVWSNVNTAGTGAKYSAGYFRIHSAYSENDIYDTSGALIADNGDSTADIFRALDGNTAVVRILDGGAVELLQDGDPGAPTNAIRLGAKDSSGSNRTLHIRTEQSVATDAALASTHSLTVWVNNVEYKIPLTEV